MYQEERLLVLENTNIASDEIYDFSDSPYSTSFASIFKFYRETLDNAIDYGIDSSFIYFVNDSRINAKAGTQNGHYIIGINSGLVISQILKLLINENLVKVIESKYSYLRNSLDNPLNVLMHQFSMHFTFYHELAHLIQKSEKLSSYLYETPVEIKQFDLTRHKLEIDADTFSGISLATHIEQYAFKMFGNNIDSERMESLMEIFCASVLTYIMSFGTYNEKIFYAEQTHPHPIVRMLNIIIVITNHLVHSPQLLKINITPDPMRMLKNTIRLAEELNVPIFNGSHNINFYNTLTLEIKNIINYLKKINDFIPSGFVLAVDKWNERVK